VRDFKSEIQRHAVSGSLLAAVQASTRTSLRILYPTALSVGFYLVPEEGLEPSRGCPHRILSPKNLLANDTQEGQAGGILKGSAAGASPSVPLCFGGLGTIMGTVSPWIPKNQS
jgi:hypothetical protein